MQLFRIAVLAFAFVGCGGPRADTPHKRPPLPDEPSSSACRSDDDCAEQMRAQCPGGSVAYATCSAGECTFEACSSPIGTPCDGDPSTQFDDESCADEASD